MSEGNVNFHLRNFEIFQDSRSQENQAKFPVLQLRIVFLPHILSENFSCSSRVAGKENLILKTLFIVPRAVQLIGMELRL